MAGKWSTNLKRSFISNASIEIKALYVAATIKTAKDPVLSL